MQKLVCPMSKIFTNALLLKAITNGINGSCVLAHDGGVYTPPFLLLENKNA